MRALGFQLVRAEDHVRRDPAPSRWHYRWQRMMLTPMFRRAVRVGLPAALLAAIAGAWFSNGANRANLAATWAEARAAIEQRPEFMVAGLTVSGATPAVAAAVAERLDIAFPVSSFDLDLTAIRAEVASLTAVRSVTAAIRPGGLLEIAVTERQPVAVWRHADGLRLIDAEGVMTGMIESRTDRADLPLIAGDGAKDAIAEALALFAAAGPIADRVRGLVRMGERRWDMVLDRDQRILLPEAGPVEALNRVIALQEAQEMLDRDIAVVDLRNAARPTLRLNATAVGVLRSVDMTISEPGAGE